MIKKYKVSRWDVEQICPVWVTRETDKSIWIPSRVDGNPDLRRDKETKYEIYFDTWSAARNYLVGKAGRAVDSAERNLVRAISELEEANSIPLEEPADD